MGMNGLQRWTAEQALSAHHATAFCTSSKIQTRKPPAHFNCRSTITFVVKDEFNLGKDIKGTRASKGATGPKQISDETNYEQWLKAST